MIVVVGGHARKTGKSAVVSYLIRALPQARWAAIKISRHSGSPLIVHVETLPGASDTGRYLAAGATRSFWIEVDSDRFDQVVPTLKGILASHPNCIIESTAIIQWLQPDLFLFVVDPRVADWKPAARECVGRASALVVIERGEEMAVPLPSAPPRFYVRPPRYHSAELAEFVAARLAHCASGSAINKLSAPSGSR